MTKTDDETLCDLKEELLWPTTIRFGTVLSCHKEGSEAGSRKLHAAERNKLVALS